MCALAAQGSVNAALLTADGGRALTLSKDCTARVWDTSTGACLHVLVGHADSVVAAALSANGTTALTLGFDRTVRAWDLASGRCRAVMVPPGGEQVSALSILPLKGMYGNMAIEHAARCARTNPVPAHGWGSRY